MDYIYKDGYTELHFQARYGSPKKVLKLLEEGHTMACRNFYGTMPVEDIDTKTLEKHLDDCVIPEFELDSYMGKEPNDIIKETIDVKLNYKTLVPDNQVGQETQKRKKIDEMDVVQMISKSKKHNKLLKHPVIKSFVDLKWVRYRWTLYINVIHSGLLSLFLILYKQLNLISKYVLYLFIITAVLIELLDIFLSPKEYFKTSKNYIDLFLIASTIYIVFGQDLSYERIQMITAIVILLSALECLLYLGYFPKFSKYALMFQKVAANFVKFFCYYLIFILSFAFCFYALFKPTKTRDIDVNGDFRNIEMTIFKTLMMLTGNYDIKFEPYPVSSRIILITYMFTIGIILMNLLNGLAVSDIQMIQNEAELLSITSKINYICHVRSYYNFEILVSKCLLRLQKLMPNIFGGTSHLYKSTIYSVVLRINYNNTPIGTVVEINEDYNEGNALVLRSKKTISNIKEIIWKKRFEMVEGYALQVEEYEE